MGRGRRPVVTESEVWRQVRDAGAQGITCRALAKHFCVSTQCIRQKLQPLRQERRLTSRNVARRNTFPGGYETHYLFDWDCRPIPGELSELGPGFGETPPPPNDGTLEA